MNIDILKLLFDFGLMILIWLVQLVIYPSFSYYQRDDLLQWHKTYTLRIGYVVMPLMIGQLSFAAVQVIQEITIFNMLSLTLILAVWIATFLQFVPLHHKISPNNIHDKILYQLVRLNWIRTGLWTMIFFLDLTKYVLSTSLL